MTNSVNNLLEALDENINLTPDNWVKEHLIIADKKKWVSNILPAELLNRSVKQAVEALVTINESALFFEKFPDNVLTPN